MRKCKVYVNGIEAGILTEFDFPRNYQFKYHEEYLNSKLPGVSLSMPLQDKEYHSPVLFPYFLIFFQKVRIVPCKHLFIILIRMMTSAYFLQLPDTTL